VSRCTYSTLVGENKIVCQAAAGIEDGIWKERMANMEGEDGKYEGEDGEYFFLTMYFGLPRYIPPHLLGETGFRKHWSTK
jgi:hypothetical protein